MEIYEIKNYIIDNNKLEFILQSLATKHIIYHKDKNYYSFCMPDGDNISSTDIFNNYSLNVKAYTRDISDVYGNSDLISLICFIKKCYFTEAIKWLCDILSLNYYQKQEKASTSLDWLKKMVAINSNNNDVDDEKIMPISEKILSYYYPYCNNLFEKDNINCLTQKTFEIGYDSSTNRITIPIRDELGVLVGIKGRLYKNNNDTKYIYLEPCAKSKILYGLYKTLEHIKNKNEVIIVEAEKGVMQLWNYGYKNAIAIGGHDISKTQIEKITRLGANIVLCFDKDVDFSIYENTFKKFIKNLNLFFVYDYDNILNDKESPSDNPNKWEFLYKNKRQYIY